MSFIGQTGMEIEGNGNVAIKPLPRLMQSMTVNPRVYTYGASESVTRR